MRRPSDARRDIYERHRPEETPLYHIVETYYPKFLARLEAEGGSLPAFVKQEFDDYLKCGGTLRVIAGIENPDVVATILEHIRVREAATTTNPRAPPINTELPAVRYQDRLP